MPKSNLRIDILGASLSISADEDPAYLGSLLKRFSSAIDKTKKSTGLTDPLKIAVLTGFLLCDELEKAKQDSAKKHGDPDSREAERLTLDLIARIDKALGD